MSKEVFMDSLPEPKTDSIASPIVAVRQAWLDAVKAGDAERLAAMVTDDIVVVHGNGRCVRGREEVKADFVKGFEAFSIELNVSSTEVVLRGRWAFEIADVESTLIPVGGGKPIRISSTTVVALGRQPDGAWKIGRVLGVLDSPLPSPK